MTSAKHSPITQPLCRRDWLGAVAALGTAAAVDPLLADEPAAPPPPKWRTSFNTSCIMGQKLPLPEQVRIASEAGYDAIEPWLRDIDQFVQSGGSLADVGKQISDAGLTVESAIGFANWIVDDPAAREAGLEQLRRDMDAVRQIGGIRIAAPPAGATKPENPKLDLLVVAERYRAALDVGRDVGVTPQLEVWGFSHNLPRLGETMFAAVESGHPDACVLPDIYHLHRGGSEFAGLKLLSGAAVHVFHVNDYPASVARAELNDAQRVYPGDGDAPLKEIVSLLRATGFNGVLSLELFNRTHWEQDPLEVAKNGRASIQRMLDMA
ncbi:MAG: sugar phosphate isomerase/epimerase [Planctomycetaceae bacterium]|nr:sugar phosphate isomerase/epimerase [Planctomycetaceae bacterium]